MAVYIVRLGEDGPVKIGFTREVDYRLKTIQRHLPYELHVLRVLDGTPADEKRLHLRFAGGRLWGEWFNFDPAMHGDLGLPDMSRVITYTVLHRVAERRRRRTFPIQAERRVA